MPLYRKFVRIDVSLKSMQVISQSRSRHTRLSELVTRLHERSGLSLRAFARELGVTHTTVGSWKKGQGNLDEASLGAIAATSGSTRDQLDLYLEGRLSLDDYLEGKSSHIPLPLVEQSLKNYSPQELNQLLKACADAITLRVGVESDGKKNRVATVTLDDDGFLPPLSLRGGRRLKNLVLAEGQRRGWESSDFINAGCDAKLYQVIMAEDWIGRHPAPQLIAPLSALLSKVERWDGDNPILMNEKYSRVEELWETLEKLENGNGLTLNHHH